MIDRWVANQIIDWPSSHSFGCRKPIIVGQKWLELVCDDNRARFHCDCEPVWRAEQEVAACRAVGYVGRELCCRSPGASRNGRPGPPLQGARDQG
jgi:hypothetical protein